MIESKRAMVHGHSNHYFCQDRSSSNLTPIDFPPPHNNVSLLMQAWADTIHKLCSLD